MDAAKLTLTYQIFKTLYNYCPADTKWENLIDYIGNKCYTKTDKLKRNNWKIINVLRQNKLENYDDLNELVEFWNNNCHKYNYIKDEKGNVIFTTLVVYYGPHPMYLVENPRQKRVFSRQNLTNFLQKQP